VENQSRDPRPANPLLPISTVFTELCIYPRLVQFIPRPSKHSLPDRTRRSTVSPPRLENQPNHGCDLGRFLRMSLSRSPREGCRRCLAVCSESPRWRVGLGCWEIEARGIDPGRVVASPLRVTCSRLREHVRSPGEGPRFPCSGRRSSRFPEGGPRPRRGEANVPNVRSEMVRYALLHAPSDGQNVLGMIPALSRVPLSCLSGRAGLDGDVEAKVRGVDLFD
jgi:hypothetical protein